MNWLPAILVLAFLAACGGAAQLSTAPHPHQPDVASSDKSLPPTHIEASAPIQRTAAPAVVVNDPDSSQVRAAPSWSWLFAQYFAVGTEGACGRSRACHAPDVADASSAYEWLERRGYIAGAQSPLVSARNSCLQWFGGNMPPRGTPNSQAAEDLRAWVAAGARND
jgi:hypothetical protein